MCGDGPSPTSSEEEAALLQSEVCVSAADSQLDSQPGLLCPIVEYPDNFLNRMRGFGIDRESEAGQNLWREWQQEAERLVAAERGDGADGGEVDDGIVFEGVARESRDVVLPPDVPVPSKEMIRRHRAKGHVPYMPWCKHCVAKAANAPAHCARPPPIDDTPEVHGDYAFFCDRRGDRENAVTVFVLKDRRKKAFAANMVPSKGSGSGFVIKQFERDLKRFGHRGAITLCSDG